ncbi:MAG: hypothetical protein ACOZJZ_01295 [Pseudomonadota bacterium]
MFRRLAAFIFSLVLSCYGLAAAAQTFALGGDDSQHAVAHLTDEAHHHHDDGSFHADDSDESQQHVLADCWLGAPLMPAGQASLPDLNMPTGSLPAMEFNPLPPPYLEGPRRPPRSLLT